MTLSKCRTYGKGCSVTGTLVLENPATTAITPKRGPGAQYWRERRRLGKLGRDEVRDRVEGYYEDQAEDPDDYFLVSARDVRHFIDLIANGLADVRGQPGGYIQVSFEYSDMDHMLVEALLVPADQVVAGSFQDGLQALLLDPSRGEHGLSHMEDPEHGCNILVYTI